MANMSYCRFENTLRDLHDCAAALEQDPTLSKLSESERQAARQLIAHCLLIADAYDGADLRGSEPFAEGSMDIEEGDLTDVSSPLCSK